VTAVKTALASTPPGQQLWIVSTSVVLTDIRRWLRQQGYVRELWQEHAHEAQEASKDEARRRRPDGPRSWPPGVRTPVLPSFGAVSRPAETVELPVADMPPLILDPDAGPQDARPAPATPAAAPAAARAAARQKSRGRKQDRRPEPRRTQTRPSPTSGTGGTSSAQELEQDQAEQSGAGR
jgi:TusA-related sulfurtransferase